jgi:outer membrane protein OmpA-like peptidoglycan-associated protein
MNFRVTGKNKFWRLKEDENPCNSHVDYIDIFFRKHRLTVNITPKNSRVRIMNIKEKFRQGIELPWGEYQLEVTPPGYSKHLEWIPIIDWDVKVDVFLNPLKKSISIIAAPADKLTGTLSELGSIYFARGNSDILPEFSKILQYNFELLEINSKYGVQLEGHCYEGVTGEENLELGEKRARSVLDYLLGLGARPERFSLVSFGAERPEANRTNCRVEFSYL